MPTYREDLHSGHKVPLVESDDILKGGIKTENIADEAVTSEKLADKAVTNNKIADEAVTERTLGDGAVTSSKIAADSVTENKIVDGAVTSEKIAPKAVTADKIEQDAVDASKIADGAVVTSKMPDGAITTAKIDDGAVTEGKIGNQAVTADKIASGAVTGGKIADGTIQNAKIHDGAITGDKLADNTIGGEKIMANSIPGSKLAEGAITSVDIQDNTLDGSKLVNGSVSGEKLVDGAITSQKLMDNTIDGSKIADSTIQNLDIRDGSIPGSKLADDAITSEKIADGAITNAKIADRAVTGLKFVDESISGEKIANGTITGEKIARETLEGVDFVNGSIDGSKIKGNSVDGSKLADGAVDYMHLKASSITNDKIADDAVSTEKIKNNTITGAKFADNSITTDKLDGTFSGQKIADNTLVGSKIVDNTITGDKIVDNTVPGSKLQDGTIQGVDIQDGTLSGAKLVDGSVSGAKIADNAITSSHLLNNSIPGSKIQDGTIENVDLKDGTLDGSKLKDNTIQTAKIADSAVTGAKLAANAVTTDKIDAGAVTTAKIANEAVTEAKIDDDAVTSAKIASGAVTTDKILNDAVTTDKIDSGAVTTSKIADTAVTEGKIDTGAVTEGKIASNAVTNTKIADGSVTEGKIGALAVTEGKIASNAVTEGKIAAGAVSTAKLADGSVTAGKIVDANVTTAKIADDAVTEAKLADGAITSDKIADDTITELQTIMDDVPTKDSVKPISSGGVLAHGSALDVSLLNADTTTTPITLATYADLSAALAAIPAEYQSGGMSIKYVLTSDNKYVQYRYMGTAITGNPNPFLNPALWQQIDEIKELQKVGINSSDELFDRSTTLFGVDIKSTNGEETPSNSYCCSPFIPMNYNTKMWVTSHNNYVYVYDANKEYLGRTNNVSMRGKSLSDVSSNFANVAYIRIIFPNSMIATARVGLTEKENLVKDYFNYDETPKLGNDNTLVFSESILNCINDKIATLRALGLSDLTFIYKNGTNIVTINDNFKRFMLIGKVSAGSSFSLVLNEILKYNSIKCYVTLYVDYAKALKDNSNDAIQVITGGWVTTNIEAIINYDGYITIDFDNQDASYYTLREFEDIVNNLNITIDKKAVNSYYLNSWVKGDWSNSANGPYLTNRQYKIRTANWLFLKKGTIIDGFFIETGQTAHVDIWDADTNAAVDINTNRTSDFTVTLAQDSKVLIWTSSAVENPTNSDITINVRITEFAPMHINNVTRLRIATFNTGDYTFANPSIVKGSDDARTKFREVVTDIDADIIATQEDVPYFNDTEKSLPRDEVFGMFKYGYRPGIVFAWSATPETNPNYHGFYSDFRLENVRGEWYNLTSTQAPLNKHKMFAVAELHIDDKVIAFCNVHYDWNDKNARSLQVQQLINFCSKYKYAIIIGDFNPENRIAQYNSSTGEWESVVQSPKYIYDEEWQVYKDAGYSMANDGYFGVFNTCEDNGDWHPYDNIVVSQNIQMKKAWMVEKEYMNDHKPVVAELVIY